MFSILFLDWRDEGKRLMIVGIFCLMFFGKRVFQTSFIYFHILFLVCNRLFLNIQPLDIEDIKAYDMLSFMPFNNAYQGTTENISLLVIL
jgi:hypothetical protein